MIQLLRGNDQNLKDIVLSDGQPAVNIQDSSLVKIGMNIQPYSSLPYVGNCKITKVHWPAVTLPGVGPEGEEVSSEYEGNGIEITEGDTVYLNIKIDGNTQYSILIDDTREYKLSFAKSRIFISAVDAVYPYVKHISDQMAANGNCLTLYVFKCDAKANVKPSIAGRPATYQPFTLYNSSYNISLRYTELLDPTVNPHMLFQLNLTGVGEVWKSPTSNTLDTSPEHSYDGWIYDPLHIDLSISGRQLVTGSLMTGDILTPPQAV